MGKKVGTEGTNKRKKALVRLSPGQIASFDVVVHSARYLFPPAAAAICTIMSHLYNLGKNRCAEVLPYVPRLKRLEQFPLFFEAWRVLFNFPPRSSILISLQVSLIYQCFLLVFLQQVLAGNFLMDLAALPLPPPPPSKKFLPLMVISIEKRYTLHQLQHHPHSLLPIYCTTPFLL